MLDIYIVIGVVLLIVAIILLICNSIYRATKVKQVTEEVMREYW